MIHILSQPPNDEFTSRLFFQLLDTVDEPFDAFYVWSRTLAYDKMEYCNLDNDLEEREIYKVDREFYWKYIQNSIKNDTVIIAIKDHLTSADLNPWYDTVPELVNPLTAIFEYYSDKKFILITSLENLEYYINYKNVTIIQYSNYNRGMRNSNRICFSTCFNSPELINNI